jgi:hypothetical protein
MQSDRRQFMLKIAVGAVVGLFLLDRVVITPAFAGWKAQSARVTALRQKVQRGTQLLEREKSLRTRWSEMIQANLPEDRSDAENAVYNALGRWMRESRVNFNSLTQQWREHPDEGYDAFECRATATGDQASLGRLLYEIETDALPARVEECEIITRDATGKQLSLSLRFSFVHIADNGKNPR